MRYIILYCTYLLTYFRSCSIFRPLYAYTLLLSAYNSACLLYGVSYLYRILDDP